MVTEIYCAVLIVEFMVLFQGNDEGSTARVVSLAWERDCYSLTIFLTVPLVVQVIEGSFR